MPYERTRERGVPSRRELFAASAADQNGARANGLNAAVTSPELRLGAFRPVHGQADDHGKLVVVPENPAAGVGHLHG
jgi:hypothetical protein